MKLKVLVAILVGIGLMIATIAAPTIGLAKPTAASISGTTTYAGSYDPSHEVLVAAHLNPYQEDPVASVHIPGPGDYSINDLPDGDYYISAFLDVHDRGDGPPEFGEPVGWYDSNSDGTPDPVTVSGGNLTNIDIELTDIDSEYIQGTVCYLGGVHGPGPVEVGLHVNIFDAPVVSQFVSLPCADYVFSGGPAGTYYISFLYDVNASSGPPEPGEPFGWYDSNGDGTPDPIIYTGDVITGVNITVGGIHYVDFSAGGNNDGSSWDDAFQDLQDALAVAESGEEIWVAAGVYTPGDTREDSFVLQHGVALYGGFNGTEAYRDQRNWSANQTVLSGEIGDLASQADNVYHVLTTASTWEDPLDQTAILDGFTITSGRANGWDIDQDKGGGLLNNFGYPTLANLIFVGNYADNHGGAIANQHSQQATSEPLSVINTIFSLNGTGFNAGGVANLNGANLLVINSSFTGNKGGNGGGIVNLLGSHAEIHNTILWGNQGAEIALQDTSTVSVTYSIIEGGYGNGVHILNTDPLFVDPDGPDNIAGTPDDNLHLQAGSPAIDAGDNTRLANDWADSNGNGNTSESTPLDIDAGDRLVDDPATPDTGNGSSPLVDIGIDEFAPKTPIAGLAIASSSPVYLGEAIYFAARATSGTQVSYTWDFGDGDFGAGPVPIYVYASPGLYPVVMTATNSLGYQQTNTTISIGEVMVIPPGGSRSTGDGALTIELPAEITSTMTISYTPQSNPDNPPRGFKFAGLNFDLEVIDADGNQITEPDPPFTVTLYYDQNALPAGMDEATLSLYRYDEGSVTWLPVTVLTRDLDSDTLTVLLDHFSTFALLIETDEQIILLPLLLR